MSCHTEVTKLLVTAANTYVVLLHSLNAWDVYGTEWLHMIAGHFECHQEQLCCNEEEAGRHQHIWQCLC